MMAIKNGLGASYFFCQVTTGFRFHTSNDGQYGARVGSVCITLVWRWAVFFSRSLDFFFAVTCSGKRMHADNCKECWEKNIFRQIFIEVGVLHHHMSQLFLYRAVSDVTS